MWRLLPRTISLQLNITEGNFGGNDRLMGGAGDDLLYGGAGSDVYIYNRGGGHDVSALPIYSV
jgi:Ca2+-binding RTX toxin-like protein